MVRGFERPWRAICLSFVPLFLLFGCAETGSGDHAECSQGASRELACGLYGTGVQRQQCGDNFRWANVGECALELSCEHGDVRTKPCGGLNDNAYREQLCELGTWSERWGDCKDPDLCQNDAVSSELCTGDDAGLNGRARRERTCEDGQWAEWGACADPDFCEATSAGDQTCGANASCQQRAGSYGCHCDEGYADEGAGCVDIDECSDPSLNTCDPRAVCSNEEATYNCACPIGMIDDAGDGRNCEAIIEVATGYSHTCAISESKALYCWGKNDDGQVGDGTLVQQMYPQRVSANSRWKQVSSGERHSCAITEQNDLYCWGNNDHAQFGNGTTSGNNRPVALLESQKWAEVVAGSTQTCAIDDEQQLFCWGSGFRGPYGDPNLLPMRIGAEHDWVAVGSGSEHSCGITTTSDMYCWGRNDNFQLGTGNNDEQETPQSLVLVGESPDDGWAHVSLKGSASLAVDGDANGYFWGPLANIASTFPSLLSQPTTKLLRLSAGTHHFCWIEEARDLHCSGRNSNGQVGVGYIGQTGYADGNIEPRGEWSEVSAASTHTCGIRDGALMCWGDNASGQLGDGTVQQRTAPVRVRF